MGKIIYRKLSEFKPLKNNPRYITDRDFNILCESIKTLPKYFEARPILLSDRTGELIIIAGNMRYQAAKKIGLEQVPTYLIEGLTEEKEKEIIIRDNVQNGKWDFEILANDWDLDQIESWGVDIPDVDLDPEPEEAEEDNFDVESNMPKNPVSKIGDIYRLGRHRLVCGDATIAEHLDALMDGKSANAYITDPPYNVDYHSADGKSIENDKMGDSQFQEFLVAAFTQADRVMRKGAAYYIWHSESEGYNFRTAAIRAGWKLRQALIWVKNNIVIGRQDYQWKHESCLYGWKDGAAHYFTTDRTQVTVQREDFDIDKLSKDDMRELLRDILHNIPSTIIEEDKPLRSAEHPTMKPVKLIGRIMKNSTRLTDIVLDNFGGSGTTIIAAEQLGRTCYMMELDPAYCDVIIKRWEELTQESAEYLGNFLEDKNSSENKQ